MPFLRFGDVIAAERWVDDEDAPERAVHDQALWTALRVYRFPNWWGSGIPGDRLREVAVDEGIPLAWVPPIDVVRELAAASSYERRTTILLDCSRHVLEGCAEMVDESTDPWLSTTQPLAASAVRAWSLGEPMAAMALAVTVSEGLAFDVANGSRAFLSRDSAEAWARDLRSLRTYKRAVYQADPANPHVIHNFKDDVVRGPISHFFTPWRPESGDPPPDRLSRHVATHTPMTSHFTPVNSLLAVMMMSSFLREMQDRAEEIRADDEVSHFDE